MKALAILLYLCLTLMATWTFSWFVNRMPSEKRLCFLSLKEIHKL